LTAVSAFFADYGEKRPKSSPTSVEFIVPNAVKSIFKQFYKSKFDANNNSYTKSIICSQAGAYPPPRGVPRQNLKHS